MMLKLSLLVGMCFLMACAEKSVDEERINAAKQQQTGADSLDSADANTTDKATPADGTDAGKPTQPAASQAAAPSNIIPSGQMETLYNRFNEAKTHHDAEGANRAAGEILTHNPNDSKVLNGLAAMAIDDGKLDLARLYIHKVLEKNPTNAAAYNNLGVVELKDDNLRVALMNFKKATELDAGNKAAHANLGTIYLKYRNYQSAMVELSAAESHGDDSVATLGNLGFALKGTGNFDDAAKMYNRGLAKDPNNVTIMLNYATLLVENLNKPKDGVKLLNKIRFMSQEPAILNKVDALARKAENPKAKGVAE